MAREDISKPRAAEPLDVMVDRCSAVLSADPCVEAVCLVGSLARGDADANSDVDLCIIVDEEHLDDVTSRSAELAARAGPVLVSGRLVDSATYCALYDVSGSIVKVDFDCFSWQRLRESMQTEMMLVYFSGCKVLFDRREAVAPLLTRAGGQPLPEPPAPSGASFTISAWSVLRVTRRGEIFEAIDIMNHMRDPALTRVLCRVHGLPFQNFRRLEWRLPAKVARRLRRTIPRPAQREVLRSLRELISLYLQMGDEAKDGLGAAERAALARIDAEILQCLP